MDEMTPEEMFNRFMEQQQKLAQAPQPQIAQNPSMLDNQPLNINEQAALETLKTNITPPAPVSSSLPKCPQCGQLHPPLKPGEKCPMAKDKFTDDKGMEIEVDVNKYLTNLKNIIVSQIESKKLKDPNKLFKELTISVMSFLEKYKE